MRRTKARKFRRRLKSGAAAAATPLYTDLAIAFTETPGRFVCEVPAAAADRFAEQMHQTPRVRWAWIGGVVAGDRLEVVSAAGEVMTIPVAGLARAWRDGLHPR